MNLKNISVAYNLNNLTTLTSLEHLWEDLLYNEFNIKECSLILNGEFHEFIIEELFTDGITLRDKKSKQLLGVLFNDDEYYWV